jgi:hypothetical protein
MQASVVKFFLVGLPVGLVALGVLSMLWHLEILPQPLGERVSGQVVGEVRADDMEEVVRVLAEVLGERRLEAAPGALRSAGSWVLSRLEALAGERGVSRIVLEGADGVGHEIYEYEIVGRRRADEVVLVLAGYDSAEGSPGANAYASGVAAVLGAAGAMARERRDRTVRFVFLPDGHSGIAGGGQYLARCLERRDRLVAVVGVGSVGLIPGGEVVQVYPEEMVGGMVGLPQAADFLVVEGGHDSGWLVSGVADAMARAGELAVEALVGQASLAGGALRGLDPFEDEGLAVVRVTDTGQLRDRDHGGAGDVAGRLEGEVIARAGRGLEAVVNELAGW